MPDEAEKRCRDYLREIPFDLKQLCTRKEWEMHGSFMVRKRFKEAFIIREIQVRVLSPVLVVLWRPTQFSCVGRLLFLFPIIRRGVFGGNWIDDKP